MDHGKRLRTEQSDAESRLWSRLRNHQLGFKFRRQHRVGGYIVDFFCDEKRLVIELDGGQHQTQVDYDAHRTAYLESVGLRVLRFWNHDVRAGTVAVLEVIWAAMQPANPPHPSPLPRTRGRGSREAAAVGREAAALATPSPPLAGERVGVRGAVDSPDSHRSALLLRAQLYGTLRSFFATRGVLEVETPMLSVGANTEPNIESFSTRFSGPLPEASPRERWLRTSPEFALKRLLVEGIGDCYEMGRVFRDGEAGRRHNPEFTMLEWYRVGWDHHALAEETCDLIERALALVGRGVRRERRSYRDLYRAAFGFDAFTAPIDALKAPLAEYGIQADDLSRDDWLDLLMTHRLQPTFDEDTLLTIMDFPPSQCALARIAGQGEDAVAERYEVYLGGNELANGYHELIDAREQRVRFENDNRRRIARGQRALPIDMALLAALEQGMPDCAGVALGIERLLMAMIGTQDIADVLAFAFHRA